jgi:hypothetical protein
MTTEGGLNMPSINLVVYRHPVKMSQLHKVFNSLNKSQVVTRLTRRVSLVEQELLTLPEHLSSINPSFSEVLVTRTLV